MPPLVMDSPLLATDSPPLDMDSPPLATDSPPPVALLPLEDTPLCPLSPDTIPRLSQTQVYFFLHRVLCFVFLNKGNL